MQVFSGKIKNGIEGIASASLFLSNQSIRETEMSRNILPSKNQSIKKCSIGDCEGKHEAKGLCRIHYRRFQTHGTVDLVPRKTRLCSVETCNRKHAANGFCAKHGLRFKQHGNPLLTLKNVGVGETPEEKFWSKVDKSKGENQCWEWQAAKDKDGYGNAWLFRSDPNKRIHLAHRIAFFYSTGIRSNFSILHSCDNPSCCNPKHLREGTHKDNTNDMVSRNRQSKGENTAKAKLKTEQVLEIRQKFKDGISAKSLSKEYQISIRSIYKVIERKSWKHI